MPTVHWQWHQKISFLCHFVCRSLMHLHSPCCCLADLTVLAKVYTYRNLAPMLVCCFQHISAGSQIRCSIIYTYDGNGAACQPCIFSIYEVSIYRTRSESSAYTDAHVQLSRMIKSKVNTYLSGFVQALLSKTGPKKDEAFSFNFVNESNMIISSSKNIYHP